MKRAAVFLASLSCLLSATSLRAGEFSPISPPFAEPLASEPPALEGVPTTESPIESNRGTLRATRPDLVSRQLDLAAPPDTFGQTPDDLAPWVRSVAQIHSDRVKLRALGKTARGRTISALEITPKGRSPWSVKRMVVLCRQHGNEPEATASGARFVYDWLEGRDPKHRAVANRTALLIVLLANPDGASIYQRRNAQNIDMNRDWRAKRSLEVRVLARWIAAWKPHLVVDNHQWLPNEVMPPPMAEASGGRNARRAALAMSQNSARRGHALAARSRIGSDALAHRFWGQRAKIPAVLLETRHRPGVPGARRKAIEQAVAALWGAAGSL